MKLKWATKTSTLVAMNLVVFGALGAQIAYRGADIAGERPEPGMYMASWKDRPSSVEETTGLSENVVRGRVTRIRKANPLRLQIAGEPGGIDTIPIEVVTIQLTDDSAKGRGKRGEQIELFHTGDSSVAHPGGRSDKPRGAPPPRPADGVDEATARRNQTPEDRQGHMGVLFSGVMNDPAYKVGEEYVLFVREGPEVTVGGQSARTQAIVSPEGRYRVNNDDTLTPMSPRQFAQGFNRRKAKELTDRARGAAGNRPDRRPIPGRPRRDQ